MRTLLLFFCASALCLACEEDDSASTSDPQETDSGTFIPLPGMLDAALPEPLLDAGEFHIVDAEPWPEDPYEAIQQDSNRKLKNLENLRDRQLIQALHNEASRNHSSLSYENARTKMFGTLDRDDDGYVECIYTGQKFYVRAQSVPDSSEMNLEHSWPQSDGAEGIAKSDLHHLFPAKTEANSRRSSWPYGETPCNDEWGGICLWEEGGSQLGINRQGHRIFEVRPEYRGDVARAHFYFAVRYEYEIEDEEEEILRKWNWQDPVDARERSRNNRIENLQHNRNPFVDRPDFVEFISDF